MQDVAGAHGALSLLFGELIQDVVMVCVGLPILFYISWQLALVSLVIGPLLDRRHLDLRTAHPRTARGGARRSTRTSRSACSKSSPGSR